MLAWFVVGSQMNNIPRANRGGVECLTTPNTNHKDLTYMKKQSGTEGHKQGNTEATSPKLIAATR